MQESTGISKYYPVQAEGVKKSLGIVIQLDYALLVMPILIEHGPFREVIL
jgi:hypothetical protein